MKTIGRHLIAEFYGCDTHGLDDLEHVRTSMLAAADEIRATVVAESFHRFAPQGVSGSVVIAESHLSIHTWPEYGYAAVDIFTCGGLDPRAGFRLLEDRLRSTSTRVQEILRGLPEEIEADRQWSAGDIHVITHMTEPQSSPPPAVAVGSSTR